MKKNILKTSAYLLASCLENWGSGKKYHFHKKETCITKGKQKINNKSLFLQYRVKYVCKITTRNIVSPWVTSSKKFSVFRSSRSQMFYKIVILKIFAISQENTCVGVSFQRPATLLKRDFIRGVFLWILQNF